MWEFEMMQSYVFGAHYVCSGDDEEVCKIC